MLQQTKGVMNKQKVIRKVVKKTKWHKLALCLKKAKGTYSWRLEFGLNTEQVERLIVYNDINADILLVGRTVPNKLATQARQSYVPYCF